MLLGKPKCGDNNKKENESILAIAIAVPLGTALLIVLSIYFGRKIKLWQKVKSERRNVNGGEMERINFEKVDKMEVNTVAGNYSVRL